MYELIPNLNPTLTGPGLEPIISQSGDMKWEKQRKKMLETLESYGTKLWQLNRTGPNW